MIFLGFVFNMAGVAFFGRPYGPLIVQGVCFLCSIFIVSQMAELAGWWDRTTMLLMLCAMMGEFFYQRRRGGRS